MGSGQLQRRQSSAWKSRAMKRVIERDGFACSLCGIEGRKIWRKSGVWTTSDYDPQDVRKPMLPGWRYTSVDIVSNLELDHILALVDGGGNDDSNLQLLCSVCHKKKTGLEKTARAAHARGEL